MLITTIDIIIVFWLAAITIWLFKIKKGPKGDRGDQGPTSYYGEFDTAAVVTKQLDDAEYMTKLIQKINSYQLVKGGKVNF